MTTTRQHYTLIDSLEGQDIDITEESYSESIVKNAQNVTNNLNWYEIGKTANLKDRWDTLTYDAKGVFITFVLIALGVPVGLAIQKTKTNPQDIATNPDFVDEANRVVQMAPSDPASQKIVDQAKNIFSQPDVSSGFDVTPETGPSQEYLDVVNDHSYIIGRISQREYDILSKAADEYGLQGVAKKLLFSIRIIEGGGLGYHSKKGTDGLEMGVGDGIPNHPARRLANDFEASLLLQGQWEAGTVSKRFTGDVEAFANRYCSENSENWVRMANDFLLSSSAGRRN